MQQRAQNLLAGGLQGNPLQGAIKRARLTTSLRDEARTRLISSKRRRIPLSKSNVQSCSYCRALSAGASEQRTQVLQALRQAPDISCTPELIKIAMNNDEDIESRNCALWCLSALTHNADDHLIEVIVCKISSTLLHLLPSSTSACWLLANLAAHNIASRILLRRLPFFDALKTHLQFNVNDTVAIERARTAAWAICSLVRGPNDADATSSLLSSSVPQIVVSNAIDAMTKKVIVVLAEHLWTCAYLSACGINASRAILKYGIAMVIVNTLVLPYTSSSNDDDDDDDVHSALCDARLAAVRCAGNLSACDDAFVDILLQVNGAQTFIKSLLECLQTNALPAIQKESAWTLANLAGGSRLHTQTVAECGVIDVVLGMWTQASYTVQKELAFTMYNFARLPEYVHAVWANGALMSVMLRLMRTRDPEASGVALEYVSLMLQYGPRDDVVQIVRENDGLEILEDLRDVRDDLVPIIKHMIDTYIDPQDEELLLAAADHKRDECVDEYPPWRRGAEQYKA